MFDIIELPIFASMRLILFFTIAIAVFSASAANNSSNLDSLLAQGKRMQNQNPESAFRLYIQAAQLAAKTGNLPAKADALKGCGVCCYFLQKYDSSLSFYKQALEIRTNRFFAAVDSANQASIAVLYHNIALVYSATGRNNQAVGFLLKSEKIRKCLGDKAGLAQFTYNSLGMMSFQEGNYVEAIRYFYKILDIYTTLGDKQGIADTQDQIGAVYYDQADYSQARNYYLKSLRIREQMRDTLSISASLNNIGLTYYAEENPAQAMNYFRKAIVYKEQYEDISGLASAHNNLSIIFLESGKPDSALHHSLLAFQYARTAGDLYKEALVLINSGAARREMKQYDFARSDLLRAMQIAGDFGFLGLRHDAASQLAELYAKTGNYAEAFRMRTLELELSDSLFNAESMRKIAVAETQYKYEAKISNDSLRNAQVLAQKNIENTEYRKRQKLIIAIAFAALIFSALIVWLFFRSYRLRQKNREDQLKREAAELENTLLRSQMNPHFIFNSMNSIQGFISENNTLSAGRYLSKFATLIRFILENSARKLIPLEDELAALKIYLELEQARFKNRFSWNILLDQNIEEDPAMIPPLLLQPFVENAILHGILHRDEQGKIDIRISGDFETGELICEICDNGVGRARAAELKKNIPGKNKSMGIGITRQRLEQLCGKPGDECMKISDLTDADGKTSGTRVILTLPYITD